MYTNKKEVFVLFSILVIVSVSKGQIAKSVTFPDSVTVPYLRISDNYILPLLDNICYYWENSPLNNKLSYAIMVPYIKRDYDTIWHIRIEQLYDFDVFSLIFPKGFPDFAKTFVSFGLLNQNNRNIFVGIKKSYLNYENDISKRIIENLFLQDTNCATFKRKVVDFEINKSDYIVHCDTTYSSCPPEVFIDKFYYAIELHFKVTGNSFVLLKNEVVKSP